MKKPTLEEILDKYMARMHEVVEELKKLINIQVEFKPEGSILIYRNIDKPGMLASLSKVLSDANILI